MADDKVIDTSVPFQPAGWGAYRTAEPVQNDRQTFGQWVGDSLKDVAAGVVSLPADFYSAGAAGADTTQDRTRLDESARYWRDLGYWIRRSKSERGQEVERNPDRSQGGLLDDIVQGALGVIPAAPIGMTGGLAPIIGGVQGYGMLRGQVDERIRDMSHEDLMKASEQYRGFIADGQTEQQARQALVDVATNNGYGWLAGGANAAGYGLLNMAGSLFTKPGTRLISQAVTDKVLATVPRRMGMGALGAGGSGAIMTGGMEYAGEAALHDTGLGEAPDIAKIAGHAAKVGAGFGLLGAAHGAFSKKPAAPLNIDTELALAAEFKSYDPRGKLPEGVGAEHRTMVEGDIYPSSSFGPDPRERVYDTRPAGPGGPGGPGGAPPMPPSRGLPAPTVGREMEGGDIYPTARTGPAPSERFVIPTDEAGARDIYWRQTQENAGVYPTPPAGPKPRQQMVEGDLSYREGFGPNRREQVVNRGGESQPQAPVPKGRPMEQGDIFPHGDFGPEEWSNPAAPPQPKAKAGRKGKPPVPQEMHPYDIYLRPEEGGRMSREEFLRNRTALGEPKEPPAKLSTPLPEGTRKSAEDFRREQAERKRDLDTYGYEPGGGPAPKSGIEKFTQMVDHTIGLARNLTKHGSGARIDMLKEAKEGAARDLADAQKQLSELRRAKVSEMTEEQRDAHTKELKRQEHHYRRAMLAFDKFDTEIASARRQAIRATKLSKARRLAEIRSGERRIEGTLSLKPGTVLEPGSNVREITVPNRRAELPVEEPEAPVTSQGKAVDRRTLDMIQPDMALLDMGDRHLWADVLQHKLDKNGKVGWREIPEELYNKLGFNAWGNFRRLVESNPEAAISILRGEYGKVLEGGPKTESNVVAHPKALDVIRKATEAEVRKEMTKEGIDLDTSEGKEQFVRRVQERVEKRTSPTSTVKVMKWGSSGVRSEHTLRANAARRVAVEAGEAREVRGGPVEPPKKGKRSIEKEMSIRDRWDARNKARVSEMVDRYFADASETARRDAIIKEEAARIAEANKLAAKLSVKGKDQTRKGQIRSRQYADREALAKQAVTHDAHFLSEERLGALMGNKLASALATKREARREQAALPKKPSAKLRKMMNDQENLINDSELMREFLQSVDAVGPERVVLLANELLRHALARVEIGKAAYATYAAKETAANRKPQIKLNIGTRAGGGKFDAGLWHNRLIEYARFASKAEYLIERVRSTEGLKKEEATNQLRDLISQHYTEEVLTHRGRLEELNAARKADIRALEQTATRLDLDNTLTDRQRQALADMRRLLDEGGESEHIGRVDEITVADSEQTVYDEKTRIQEQAEARNNPFFSKIGKEMEARGTAQRADLTPHEALIEARAILRAYFKPDESAAIRQQKIASLQDWLAERRKDATVAADREQKQELPGNLSQNKYEASIYGEMAVRQWRQAMAQMYGPAWGRLDPLDQQRLARYTTMHATSLFDNTSIHERISFMRRLEERVDPQTYMHDRGAVLQDRIEQLHNATMVRPDLDFTKPMTKEEVRTVHKEMREAMGEKVEENPTVDTIIGDFYAASAEIERIETEMRTRWEQSQGVKALPEYGMGRLLDSTADLREPGALPRGARVSKVGAIFGPHNSTYGLMGGMRGLLSTRAALVRHFMNVVNKTMGHLDIVQVSHEQLAMLARERDLPGDTRAFYDPITDRIFISHEVMNSTERGRVLIHEVAHAMTESAMQRFPAVIKRFEEIRRTLKAAYNNPKHPAYEDVRAQLGDRPQALDNVHEFISEFWANDAVSFALDAVNTGEVSRARMQTGKWDAKLDQMAMDEKSSLLSKMGATIRDALMKWFGTESQKRLLNDATVHALDLLRRIEEQGRMRPKILDDTEARPLRAADMKRAGREFMEGTTETAKEAYHQVKKMGGPSGLFIRWRNFADLGRMADKGMQDAVHEINDVQGRIKTTTKTIIDREDAPILRQVANAMRAWTTEHFERVQDYINHEKYAGVYGDAPLVERDAAGERTGANKWVSDDPNDTYHRQARADHAALQAKWNDLPSTGKVLVKAMRTYYAARYAAMRNSMLKDLVHLRGMVPSKDPAATEALVRFLSGEKLSTAEEGLLNTHVPGYDGHAGPKDALTAENRSFKEMVSGIRDIPEFRQLQGPYYPMMRHGNYVVEARYNMDKLATAARGERVDADNDTRYEFKSLADAQAFIDSISGGKDGPTVKVLHTGKNVYEVDATGAIVTSEGKKKLAKGVDGEAPVGEERHWVEVNPLLLEFHETERGALSRLDELREAHKTGEFAELNGLQQRRLNHGKYVDPKWSSRNLQSLINSMEQSEVYRGLTDKEKESIRSDWEEAAFRHMLSTSARSRFLPRQYAKGANKEMMKDMLAYAHNTSTRLAELQHRSEMRDAIKAMDDHVKANVGRADDPYTLTRSQIQEEVIRRLNFRDDPLNAPIWSRALAPILKLSFLDKLASPGFLVLNASEPWMIVAPLLAGKHGFKAYGEIARAYKDVGFTKIWGQSFTDFAKVWKAGMYGDPQLTDNLQLLKDRLAQTTKPAEAKRLNELLDYLHETGYLDRDAGMEMEKLFGQNAGSLTGGLDHVDNLFRQFNTQVENVNRAVTAIAAYRLAEKEGMNHKEAIRYAQMRVEEGAGNYAAYNAPTAFRSPFGRMAFQFKKYALRVTTNYLRMALGALKGTEEGSVARKQLLAAVATQVAVAGVLGLPTEPLKAVANAMNQLGLTDMNADDWEAALRANAASVLGKDGAEALTRGIPRLLGLGIGTRLAHDNLWTYGSLGTKSDSMATAVGHLVMGAPGGYMVETLQGMRQFFSGIGAMAQGGSTKGAEDMMQGMAKLIPMKVWSDTLMAISDHTFPKHTPSGQPSSLNPTPFESALNITGFRSGRQQEAQEKRTAFNRASQKEQESRMRVMRMYAQASTPAEKRAIWADVVRNYNTVPDRPKITYGELLKYDLQYQKKEAMDPALLGVNVNRRNRYLWNDNTYNV